MSGARHFTELVAWQLADELRGITLELTRRQPFALDFRLRAQTEDAVHSVCRNISEGFGCGHVEFARYLEISIRSLNELGDALHGAVLARHVTTRDIAPARAIAGRLFPALGRLRAHLLRTPDPPHRQRGTGRRTHLRSRPSSPASYGGQADKRQPNRTDKRQLDRTDER